MHQNLSPRELGRLFGEVGVADRAFGFAEVGEGVAQGVLVRLDVRCIEPAVAGVGGIEFERDQATGIAVIAEPGKDSFKIDVGGKSPVGLVEDVEISIRVRDKDRRRN